MKPPALTKLTIAYLRGSVDIFELPFEKGKKLTLIYGENGTGKTTICDALEFLSKGRIGSLDNRGLGKTNKYWNTVSQPASRVAVMLETAGGTCQGKLIRDTVVVEPEAARPRVEVLRRSQILALLEARPSDRYAAISRFIDVSGVEESEKTLRALIRDLNSSRDLAVARIQENLEILHEFWKAAGRPGPSLLDWAIAEMRRRPDTEDPTVAALRSLRNAYSRLSENATRLPGAEHAVRNAQASAAARQQQIQTQIQQIADDAGEVVRVLEAAQAYLNRHTHPTVCPLCESPAAADGLAERITERLQEFSALRQQRAEQRLFQDALRQVEAQRDNLRGEIQRAIFLFEQARTTFAWPPDIRLPATPAPQALDELDEWLAATAKLPEHWEQAEAARQDQRKFLATLRQALRAYQENLQGQQELDLLLPNLQRTLDIVVEERKAFTDGVLSQIASEVGRLYEAVHPGERLNRISLELDPKKRASLDISTTFSGQAGTPPQAYFSQSHLDTLGLCVFLALAGLEDASNTILILDDVLTSVDEPHVDRLIEMLYNEANRFRHCIITTHYGPWKHKMRWGWLRNGPCQFVELSRWTNTTGMAITRSVPDVERLRALLDESPPDPQLVCAKAGVILEAALEFLTQLYQCAVPRKPEPRYTLGELLPALGKKLRQALRIEIHEGTGDDGTPRYRSVPLAPILDELTRIAQTRNVVGCHFNAIAFDMLDTDALLFGRLVLELIETLADPEAGWPRSDKSGTYWANAGETRRLHPLRQPA